MKNILSLSLLVLLCWFTHAIVFDDPAVLDIQNTLLQKYNFWVSSHLLDTGDSCVDSTDFAQCLRNQDTESELIFAYNKKLNKLDANTREDIAVVLPRTETLRLEQFAAVYIAKGNIASWYVAYLESVWESLQKACKSSKAETCTTAEIQIGLQKKYSRQWSIFTRLNRFIYILLWMLAIYLVYQAYFAKRKSKTKANPKS